MVTVTGWGVVPTYTVIFGFTRGKQRTHDQLTNNTKKVMMEWKMYFLSNMANFGIYLKFRGGNLWIHWEQNDKQLVIACEIKIVSFLFDGIL